MRTPKDRIRHALSFEITALVLIAPIGAWLFGMPLSQIGTVAIAGSLIATGWTYFYNYLFDRALIRLTGSIAKTVLMRVLHAVLFEAGLLIILMPYIAWHLGVSLWQALVMDISFALFYVVYAFAFNWLYDVAFPVAQGGTSSA